MNFKPQILLFMTKVFDDEEIKFVNNEIEAHRRLRLTFLFEHLNQQSREKTSADFHNRRTNKVNSSTSDFHQSKQGETHTDRSDGSRPGPDRVRTRRTSSRRGTQTNCELYPPERAESS